MFDLSDPGSYCLYQAFIRTDVFGAGLLTLGQTIEMQYSSR
jgi:hypothetical protein